MKNNTFTKTFLLLLINVFLIGGAINAQSYEFAPVGAEWYYTRYYRVGYDLSGIACDRFSSVRTVDVNGIECKEIELYRHLDCNGMVNPYAEVRYVYQDGDLVYEVEDGELYLLYDFSKEPGEYWVAPKYEDTIFVQNVSQITLDDGTTRKVLEIDASNYNWWMSDVIEGIGMEVSLFPQQYVDGACSMPGQMRCYFENGIQLISSSIVCDYEVLAVDEEYDQPLVFINTLVDDVLHVSFAESIDSPRLIQIFDVFGKLVYRTESMDKSLDISFDDKRAGVYVCRISISSKIMDIKFLKR